MLALESNDVTLAHEEVFGYRPSGTTVTAADPAPAVRHPCPPSAPAPSRARPPRHPPQGRSGGLAPRQPPQRVLGQQLMRMAYTPAAVRQAPRRRIIIGGNAASVPPPASAAASPNGSMASTLRGEYYGDSIAHQDALVVVSEPAAHGYSSPIRPSSATASGFSATVTTLAQTRDSLTQTQPGPSGEPVRAGAAGVDGGAPRTNPYYYTFQTPPELIPSDDDVAGEDAVTEPPRASPAPLSREGHRAAAHQVSQAAGGSGSGGVAASGSAPPTARPTSSQPRLTASPSPHPGSAADTSVFERLAGASMVGMSMLGRRAHQWAEGAGIMLTPSSEAWAALRAYSLDPLQHERLWRQVCAKGRHRLALLARAKVGGSSGGGEGGGSANGSREHSSSRLASHADPHHEGALHGPYRRGSAGRRRSMPSSTPGGLAAYRRHQEYTRWCQWQLWHFFEQGSKYLTSVWRIAPTVGGAGSESTTSTTATPLSLIFDGRYAVPCAATIAEAQSTYKAQERRAKTLLRLLLEEHGTSSTAGPASGRGRSAARHGNPKSASDGADEGGNHDDDDVNVYHSINESRRSSEAVAATEPYVDVRVDATTGLMHVSLYLNGDAGGNDAAFAGSCVAGCLDNHRWLVLHGLWARQVIFFCFRKTSASGSGGKNAAASTAADDLSMESTPHALGGAYNAQAEHYVSRRSQIVDGFVVKGVAFAKAAAEQSAATAQDSVACTRCGHTRHRHSEAYVSKETGRMMRGVYYCVVCRARTHHVRLPTARTMPAGFFSAGLDRSGLEAAGVGDATPMQSVRGASHRSVAAASALGASSVRSGLLPSARSGTRSAALTDAWLLDTEVAVTAMREWTRASAAVPRPAWNSVSKVNSDALFGRTPRLDRPPPRPRL